MLRRTIALLITLTLALLVAPLAAEAQPPATHVHRIGLLSSRSPLVARPYVEAFQQRLRALGYIEGQNLAIEDRMPRVWLNDCPSWRPSWSDSRWRCWWPREPRQSMPRSTPRARSRS